LASRRTAGRVGYFEHPPPRRGVARADRLQDRFNRQCVLVGSLHVLDERVRALE
jgi:hypothetical protein